MLASDRLVGFAVKLARDPLLFSSFFLATLLLIPHAVHCASNEVNGLVRIGPTKQITAYNNRNLTIECHVDLSNRSSENPSFSTNGRMVLTFMTIPRELKPLHQMQSFLHCFDPGRTRCWAEFNFDLSCLEDQMNYTYYNKVANGNYMVEAACQVDDTTVCGTMWMERYPLDCYDLGQINVMHAPKLSERCAFEESNKTLECGENQHCHSEFGICLCKKGYSASNRRCVPLPYTEEQDELAGVTEKAKSSTYTAVTEPTEQDLGKADSKGTFKAIVLFLLVVAILLCIVLGGVIIWSRHYRHLLEDVSR